MELIGRDLACIRGGREVFASVGFHVDAGKALLVVGPNGSGKSSLLRLIAGLLRPAAGTVALNGGKAELSVAEQAHYLGHQDALKPSLSVRENLEFWAAFLGGGTGNGFAYKTSFLHENPPPNGPAWPSPETGRSADKNSPEGGQSTSGGIEGAENQPGHGAVTLTLERGRSANESSPGGGQITAHDPSPSPRPDPPSSVDGEGEHPPDNVGAALGAVGLDELADLPAAYLSAGQRRRLSIARLLAVPRPLWLLDEPSAALDAAAQVRLTALMHGHLSGGGLILAATHGPLGLNAAQELRLGGAQ